MTNFLLLNLMHFSAQQQKSLFWDRWINNNWVKTGTLMVPKGCSWPRRREEKEGNSVLSGVCANMKELGH